MITIKEMWPSKRSLATAELGPAAFVPYACHYDPQTLLTKNGQLLQVLQIDGFSFESADSDEIEFKKRLRNMLFKSVATQEYALWFHIIRKRQPFYPAGEYAAGFAELVNEQWKMRHAEHQRLDLIDERNADEDAQEGQGDQPTRQPHRRVSFLLARPAARPTAS